MVVANILLKLLRDDHLQKIQPFEVPIKSGYLFLHYAWRSPAGGSAGEVVDRGEKVNLYQEEKGVVKEDPGYYQVEG